MDSAPTNTAARVLLWVQGIYFAITGVWPILHMASFLAVTGPKQDLWLVQTVGAILALMGIVMCVAAGQRAPVTTATIVLAIGSAAVLTAVDVVFTASGAIAPIYLLDAAAEVAVLVAWGTLGILMWREEKRLPRHLALTFR